MKAILMSIRSPHTCNILNLIKLWEIRKRFPKDYVGWVYIYCTKDSNKRYQLAKYKGAFAFGVKSNEEIVGNKYQTINGKVVARFWCDKVDNYVNGSKLAFENGTYIFGTNSDFETILKPSCLTEDEIYDYCEDLSFKAIHITKLEIFDKPKELSEFKSCKEIKGKEGGATFIYKPLTRAPQSWCYVEA